MAKADLIIHGTIVQSNEDPFDGEVAIENGRIAAVTRGRTEAGTHRVLQVGGSWIMPGVVDAHVHCLSDPNEGITNATKAAAAGGVTTIIEMPFDAGAPVNNLETFRRKSERVEKEAVVDVALLATIRKRGGLDQIGPLAEAGACGFKLSLFETDPERFPQIPDDELLQAFRLIAETGLVVGVHAENTEIVNQGVATLRSQGRTDALAHCESRPPVSETEATLRALELAHATGANLHIFHVSLARCIQLARWFREQGLDVTTETCPHYLLLNEGDMERLGAKAKINPPVRTRKENEQLWALVENGAIDLVTSDHAPWQLQRKRRPDIFDNASGAPGVQTLLPLLYSEGVAKGRLSVRRLVQVLCDAPARRFGFSSRKGCLEPGYDADIVVLNPAETSTVETAGLLSSAGWSPYEGMTLQGRITHVFVRGRAVVEDGEMVGQPGYGHFLPGAATRGAAASSVFPSASEYTK
jgi:allantoinase